MPAAPEPEDQLARALRLLPRVPHGRAAVTWQALPHILAAQHRVSGDEVVLRVPAGRNEVGNVDGAILAYEASVDGQSVHLIGTARIPDLTGAEEAGYLHIHLTPHIATFHPEHS